MSQVVVLQDKDNSYVFHSKAVLLVKLGNWEKISKYGIELTLAPTGGAYVDFDTKEERDQKAIELFTELGFTNHYMRKLGLEPKDENDNGNNRILP